MTLVVGVIFHLVLIALANLAMLVLSVFADIYNQADTSAWLPIHGEYLL